MKTAEFRATHGNPHGSDYQFTPDEQGNSILRQAWNVVKGLGRERSLNALNAKRIDPRSVTTREKLEEAHDTNQFILGEGRFGTALMVPNREPKKKRKKH